MMATIYKLKTKAKFCQLFFLAVVQLSHVGAMEKTIEQPLEIKMPDRPLKTLKALMPLSALQIVDKTSQGTVTVKSFDNKKIELPRFTAELSELLKNMIQDIGTGKSLLISLKEPIFTKLIDGMKAINDITTTERIKYAGQLFKKLRPIFQELSFADTLELIKESNKLNIPALTWYLAAMLVTGLQQNKNIDNIGFMTKNIVALINVRDLILNMFKEDNRAHLLIGPPVIEFKVPISYKYIALRALDRNNFFALTSANEVAYLWDLNNRKIKKKLVTCNSICSLTISPDGKYVLIGLLSGEITLWNLTEDQQELRPIKIFKDDARMTSAVISTDNQYSLMVLDNRASIWSLGGEKAKKIKKLKEHRSVIWSVGMSSDCKLALSSGPLVMNPILWNLTHEDKKLSPYKLLKGHRDWTTSVALSCDGQSAVTGSVDETAILWDLTKDDPQPVKKLINCCVPLTSVHFVAYSPNKKYVVTGDEHGRAYLWDLTQDKRKLEPISILSDHSPKTIQAITFSSDSNCVLTAGLDQRVIVWDISAYDKITLTEMILLIKLQQLGGQKVLKNDYFKAVWETSSHRFINACIACCWDALHELTPSKMRFDV